MLIYMEENELNIFKIKPILKIIENNEKNVYRTKLVINIKNTTFRVLNVFKRLILTYFPLYVFAKDDIIIKHNDDIFKNPVFTNDELKQRISLFPIYIENNVNMSIIIEKFINQTDNEYILKEIHDDNELQIFCNEKNSEKKLKIITTNDIKYYKNNKEIKNIYKNPYIICILKQNEELNFTAKSSLKIENDNIFNVYYKKKNETEYDFTIESSGQVKNIEVLNRTIEFIQNKIKEFIKKLEKQKIEDDEFVLKVEDLDIGIYQLIVLGCNANSNIEMATVDKEHILKNTILLKIKAKKDTINELISSNQDIIKYLENYKST